MVIAYTAEMEAPECPSCGGWGVDCTAEYPCYQCDPDDTGDCTQSDPCYQCADYTYDTEEVAWNNVKNGTV